MAKNLLTWGERWLAKTKREHATTAVTYARGGTSIEWAAEKGRRSYDAPDSEGGVIVVESHDFIGLASELILNGGPTLPTRGDRITDETGQAYEVLSIGGGDAYRWADAARLTLRVHTKRVGGDVNPGEAP